MTDDMNSADRAHMNIAQRAGRAGANRGAGATLQARRANADAMAAVRARGPMATKTSGILALMAAGDMRGAILAAARLPELGAYRDAILGAKEAIMNPGFQRQLKRDPDALLAAGFAALKEKFK